MAKADRLIFLTTLFNKIALNDIAREEGLKSYEPIIGVNTGFVPVFLKNKKYLLKYYLFILTILSPIWIGVLAIKSFLELIKTPKIQYKENKIFLLASIALPKVVANANIIEEENEKWLELPWVKMKEARVKNTISVFNLINTKDVFCVYQDAVIVFFYILFKKGYMYVLQAVHAFDWFLFNKAIRHIPEDVELIFANHKDDYAPLFDHLPHKRKTLVQHGTEIVLENPRSLGRQYYSYNKQYNFWTHNLPCRYKNVSKLYCFSKKEKLALFSSVLNCNPVVTVVGYSLKSFNENLVGEKAILIVGYYERYYEKEKNLISILQGKGVKIYLKNHPVFSASVYNELKSKFDFILLNGPLFPKVDVVFSYSSTLALEYEALGIRVVLYDNMDYDSLNKMVDEIF